MSGEAKTRKKSVRANTSAGVDSADGTKTGVRSVIAAPPRFNLCVFRFLSQSANKTMQ
jgi:hypothetical protein